MHIHIHEQSLIYIHVRTYVYTYMHIHVHEQSLVYIHVRTYVRIYMHIHVYYAYIMCTRHLCRHRVSYNCQKRMMRTSLTQKSSQSTMKRSGIIIIHTRTCTYNYLTLALICTAILRLQVFFFAIFATGGKNAE